MFDKNYDKLHLPFWTFRQLFSLTTLFPQVTHTSKQYKCRIDIVSSVKVRYDSAEINPICRPTRLILQSRSKMYFTRRNRNIAYFAFSKPSCVISACL